jgi:integrase
MPDIKLPYLQWVKAKGHDYAFYRRNGVRQRIKGDPGGVEFLENYYRIHRSFENEPKIHGATPGSFEALVRMYYASPEYKGLGERAKAEYKTYIELLREKNGKQPIRTLSRRDVLAMRDSLQETPSKANHLVKVLRVVLNFAVDREMLDINPASRIKKLEEGDGWQAWPAPSLERAHKALTGPSRIAFMLALYTGQRKGDVLAMRWSDIQDGFIHVVQSKTKAKLAIPLHPALADELETVRQERAKKKIAGMYIVGRRDGGPLTESGFNRIWRRQQEKHGFKGLQFHGLRKNATTALYEAECTPQQVQAITGHASLQMVEHYGKGANQKRLATDAMNKWQTSSGKLSAASGKPNGGDNG